MKMLDDFLILWYRRFKEDQIDKIIADRCFKKVQAKWIEVPYLLHKEAIEKSLAHVSPLILGQKPVVSLSLHDVSVSGIDFHCSNVLDSILQNQNLYSKLSNELVIRLENTSVYKTKDGFITKDSLKRLLKGYMWTFCSGVNVRRSFAGNIKQPLNQTPMYQFWSGFVAPHVNLFATSYITCRLSKCQRF